MSSGVAAKRRSVFLINRKFQLKFSFYVCSWIILLSCVYPMIIYDLFDYFVRFLAGEGREIPSAVVNSFKVEVIQLLILMHFAFLVLTFLISLFVSHRIAGPIYKLRKSLDGARKGRLEKVTFRSKDNFQELAESYNEAVELLFSHSKKDQSGSVHAISAAIARLENVIDHPEDESKEEFLRILEDLKIAREKI